METPDSLVSGRYYRFVGDSVHPTLNSGFIGSVVYVDTEYKRSGNYRHIRLIHDPGLLETDYFPTNATDLYEELTEEEAMMYIVGGER